MTDTSRYRLPIRTRRRTGNRNHIQFGVQADMQIADGPLP